MAIVMLNKKFFICILMPILLIVVILFSLTQGSNKISFFDTLNALFDNAGDENIAIIIKHVRLPRTVMACIVGAGLAVCGCVFQAILKNPLSDPFTLGISGGAAFGTILASISGLAVSGTTGFFIPLCAFAGAMISVLVVYLLSMHKSFNSNVMVLSGVVVSYIFSSAVMIIFALSSSNSIQASFVWLMGNLSMFDEGTIIFVISVILMGTIILSLCGNIINVISLGGEKSKTFGINIEKYIKFLFITASFITAVTVSVCGIIGFVGLMIPHIMRRVFGTNNMILIPASFFAGAIFLSFCDTLSRILFSPVMIPVGVITSIIGGSFFIFLVFKAKRI
jgi:iron complex transport system permease protein